MPAGFVSAGIFYSGRSNRPFTGRGTKTRSGLVEGLGHKGFRGGYPLPPRDFVARPPSPPSGGGFISPRRATLVKALPCISASASRLRSCLSG